MVVVYSTLDNKFEAPDVFVGLSRTSGGGKVNERITKVFGMQDVFLTLARKHSELSLPVTFAIVTFSAM